MLRSFNAVVASFVRRGSLHEIVTLVVTVGVCGCHILAPRSATPDSNVGIGVAFNPTRAGMEEITRGVTLATEELARDPAAKAMGLHFVMRRAPQTLTSAVEVATALRDDASVVAIVGDAESGRTLDAVPVYEDVEHAGARAVVAISPTATSPALSGRSAWVFRVTPSDVAISQATAAYLVDSLGARRAAVIYRNDSYGRDWAATFVRAFKQRGGTVVQRDPYVTGITEWGAIAGYSGRSKPDVILFPGSAEDAADYLRALKAAAVRVPFIGGDAVSPLATQPEFAGARYATPYAAEHAPHTPTSEAFVAGYRARWHVAPSARAALAYDATLVIGKATIAVGANRTRVRDWIAGVGSAHAGIAGATGTISFDGAHDARDRVVTIATVSAAPVPNGSVGGAR